MVTGESTGLVIISAGNLTVDPTDPTDVTPATTSRLGARNAAARNGRPDQGCVRASPRFAPSCTVRRIRGQPQHTHGETSTGSARVIETDRGR